MKRILPTSAPLVRSQRLQNVEQQIKHFGFIHAEYAFNAIKAANVRATFYEAIKNGPQCSCGHLNKTESLLDEEGNLTPTSVAQLTSHFSADDLLLADNFTSPHESETVDLLQLDAFNQGRCGICYGVGYKGGYTISSGFRFVLDYRDIVQTDHDITKGQPYYMSGGSFATFQLLVPSFPNQSLTKYNVWNNDKLVTDYTISDLIYGESNSLLLTTPEDFTHIEIQLEHGQAFVDFPQVPANFSPDIMSSDFTTIMHIPHNLRLTKYSIVHETRFNRCWQVRELNPHINNGVTLYYEADVRLISQFELYNLLASTK